MISRGDAKGFEDVLSSTDRKKGDLLINSRGGMPNAAEKILMMCRNYFSESFEVIVPDYAKSAATMIAIGADKINMGHLSELGPVDPQLVGGPPAQSLLLGLNYIRERIKENNDPLEMYIPMLRMISPNLIASCENAIRHSRRIIKKWLGEYMLDGTKESSEDIARKLCGSITEEGFKPPKYKSHGKVIDYKEARKIGLEVNKIPKDTKLWERIWEVYCRGWNYLTQTDSAKIFVSAGKFLAQLPANE